MNSTYPWIYVDYRNDIWKFFEDNNKELCYKIMYGEGKWTKDNLIDKEVLGFALYVEKDGIIHIVYSNVKGELKYCTMKNKQWVGKVLYQIDINEFKLQDLKVEIIGMNMHILYLLVGNDGSDHGVLMHCIWDGKEIKATTLQDIILIPNVNEHYIINITEENNMEVFFITDEGDEISLNYCSYENNIWSSSKRLYGIKGEDIGFELFRDNQDIHILNKSREDSIYFLDHVHIDVVGNIQEFRVYESSKELAKPLIFIEDNKLYSCWLEQGKIYCSVFENEKWSNALHLDSGNDFALSLYNCFISSEEDSSIRYKKVYATNNLDFYLYIPSQFAISMKDSLKDDKNKNNENMSKEERMLQKLKHELSRVKLEKKGLENKIESLNIQLQKKQRFMEEYEEGYARLLEQKRKADENYKVFLELQQNIKNELENTIKKLSEEQKIRESIENKLKESNNENISIKQQVEIMSTENKRLYKELELERNQTIMDRLLKK